MVGIKPFIALLFFFFINPTFVHAHCPLCTGAVAMAAVTANYYGMDLVSIGLFVGAFGISTGLWVGRKIKNQYFKFQLTTVVLLSFLLTVMPLQTLTPENIYLSLRWFGEPGTLFNKVYWMNRLFFGSLLGGVLSVSAFFIHHTVKKFNQDTVLFPFQGIAFTLGALVLGSIVVQLVI